MLTAFLLLFLDLRAGKVFEKRTESVIAAFTGWMLYLFLIVEILSCFKILDRTWLMVMWGLADAILLARLLIKKRYKTLVSDIRLMLKQCNFPWMFAALSLFMLVLSVLTVPYNWDSMTYHLTRIAYWAQNKSVAHYATISMREIASPVLAEFVNTCVYILCGKQDVLLNLLQTFSYLAGIVLVNRISIKMGISSKKSMAASVMFACMPIAFAEALSTQVDEFAAVWVLIFVYTVLDFIMYDDNLKWNRLNAYRLIVLSLSIAFGYLAKPSVIPEMLIFLIWMIIVRLKKKDNIRTLIAMICVAALCILAAVSPELTRNIRTFHALSSGDTGARQIVGTDKPNYIIVNGIKNYAYNLSDIYIYAVKFRTEKAVYSIASAMGVDINDESISEGGVEYTMGTIQNYDHDSAVNPVTVIFSTIAFLYLIFRLLRRKEKRSERQRLIDAFTFITFFAFIVFCLMVRWEFFVTRYMLSYLALLCIGTAGQIDILSEHNERAGYAVSVIIYFVCFVELFGLMNYHLKICYNQVKAPYRSDGYFFKRDEVEEDYEALMKYINSSDYKCIGLRIYGDTYKYPIFAMTGDKSVSYHEVLTDDIENCSAIYDDKNIRPECIICTGNDDIYMDYHGLRYKTAKKIGMFCIALPE